MITQSSSQGARFRFPAWCSAALILIAGITIAPEARAQSGLPTWVSNLPFWQWYAIPNTALSSVEPNPPLQQGYASAKIDAWCGATLKRSGSVYMIGASGGHADYAGNEVDALALNTETPQWVELRASSPWSQMINASQFYLDLKPSATHTYYATQFINARNRLLVMPSPGMGASYLPPAPAGWPYNGDAGYTFSYNVGGGDWDPPNYIARYTGSGDFTAAMVAKHPITEDIYLNKGSAGWWRWTQAANTWTRINGNNNPNQNYSGAAVDPIRSRILIVGSWGGSLPPRVLDLDGNAIPVTFGGLGVSALTMGDYPGVMYDETNDRFLVVFNSGGAIKIRRVNPATWFVDEPAVSGTAPGQRTNGISNSAQYVPELGGIVIANKYDGNVFFIRTAPTSSDFTPPAAPSGVLAR